MQSRVVIVAVIMAIIIVVITFGLMPSASSSISAGLVALREKDMRCPAPPARPCEDTCPACEDTGSLACTAPGGKPV